MAAPHRNVMGTLGNGEYQATRRAMIEVVLATDMARHFQMLEAFETDVVASAESALRTALRVGSRRSGRSVVAMHPGLKRRGTELQLKSMISRGGGGGGGAAAAVGALGGAGGGPHRSTSSQLMVGRGGARAGVGAPTAVSPRGRGSKDGIILPSGSRGVPRAGSFVSMQHLRQSIEVGSGVDKLARGAGKRLSEISTAADGMSRQSSHNATEPASLLGSSQRSGMHANDSRISMQSAVTTQLAIAGRR